MDDASGRLVPMTKKAHGTRASAYILRRSRVAHDVRSWRGSLQLYRGAYAARSQRRDPRSGNRTKYAYDKVGNREDPVNAALYGYDNNHRITASPGLTYTFDPDGSVATRSDGATYTHDYRSRLTQFVKGATSASYLYDAFGRRIKKTVNGAVTWYLWDGTSVLSEYNAAGTRTQRYAYLADDHAPAQLEDVNGTVYVHADHLDAPRLATSTTGVVVWRARYQAFGIVNLQVDPDGNGQQITINHRFPGQYADVESGSYYNYFRNYDPTTGRYLQADPIGHAGDVNPYRYAEDLPTSVIDPEGLKARRPSPPRGPNNAQEAQGWHDIDSYKICTSWFCPQDPKACRIDDYRKPNAFMPAATNPYDRPSGCICAMWEYRYYVVRKRETYENPNEQYKDAVDQTDAAHRRKEALRWINRNPLPWWERLRIPTPR